MHKYLFCHNLLSIYLSGITSFLEVLPCLIFQNPELPALPHILFCFLTSYLHLPVPSTCNSHCLRSIWVNYHLPYNAELKSALLPLSSPSLWSLFLFSPSFFSSSHLSRTQSKFFPLGHSVFEGRCLTYFHILFCTPHILHLTCFLVCF